jgi:hypothetical protein
MRGLLLWLAGPVPIGTGEVPPVPDDPRAYDRGGRNTCPPWPGRLLPRCRTGPMAGSFEDFDRLIEPALGSSHLAVLAGAAFDRLRADARRSEALVPWPRTIVRLRWHEKCMAVIRRAWSGVGTV